MNGFIGGLLFELEKSATPEYQKILQAAAKRMAPKAAVTDALKRRAASSMGVSPVTEPSREALKGALRQFSESFPKGKRSWGQNLNPFLGSQGQLLAPDAGFRSINRTKS